MLFPDLDQQLMNYLRVAPVRLKNPNNYTIRRKEVNFGTPYIVN